MDTLYAGQSPERVVERIQTHIMNRFDGDGSGDISLAEAGERGRLARNFWQIDANENGLLSQDEIGAALATRTERSLDPSGPERMNAMAAWMQMQEANQQKLAEFDRIDTNADGSLSDTELAARLDALRTAEEAERSRDEKIADITRMDTDGNGRLSARELAAELELRSAERRIAAFDAIDTDGNGTLSDAEIAARLTERQAETTIAARFLDASDERAASDDVAERSTLSLIENVFEDMLEDRGESPSLDRLRSMSQSLYAEAQEILIDQLEKAAEFVGEPDNQDDDQVAYT